MRYIKLLLLITLNFLPAFSYAAFDDISPGVRPSSIGGAFTALSDDANAIFYNPAGLYRLKNNELTASYGKFYWGLTDGSNIANSDILYVNPFGKYGAVGMGIYSLSLDSLYSERIIMFSYGLRIVPKLGFGATMKSLTHVFGSDEYTENAIDDTGNALGMTDDVFAAGKSKSKLSSDIGLFYRPESRYNLGFVIQNINSPSVGLIETDTVEKTLRAGFSYSPRTSNLVLEMISKINNTDFIAGFEKYFSKRIFALRGGMVFGSKELRRLSLGFGIKKSIYKIDYALLYPLTGINNTYGTHKLAFSIVFGPVPGIEQLSMEFPPEEEELTGEGAVIVDKIITEDDKNSAGLLVKVSQDLYRKGMYQKSLENINKALEYNPTNQGAQLLKKKLSPIAIMFPEETGDEKISKIMRKGLTAYFDNNPVLAVNAIRYATELAPEKTSLNQLFELITKEFPGYAAQEESISGLTLVSRKLQQALENIYNGKYVQAITECKTVLELEEDNIVALMRLGSAYWAMGDFDKAKSVWRDALRYDPNNVQIREFLKGETTVPKVEKLGEKPLVRKYAVQRGDTPQKISEKFYGNKTSWSKIYEANKDILPNRWTISYGQELNIP